MGRRLRATLAKVLPGSIAQELFFADYEWTSSARNAVVYGGVGSAGLLAGGVGVLLLADEAWREVLAGAFLAWGVAVPVWAVASFRRHRGVVRADLERKAEIDLVHARLNQIANAVDAPLLNLDYQLQFAVWARMERLAHLNGLEEFRGSGEQVPPEGWAAWDETARGYPHRTLLGNRHRAHGALGAGSLSARQPATTVIRKGHIYDRSIARASRGRRRPSSSDDVQRDAVTSSSCSSASA